MEHITNQTDVNINRSASQSRHLGIWGSILVFYAFLLFYCGIIDVFGPASTTGGMYWLFYDQAMTLSYWMYLPLIFVVAALPTFTVHVWKSIYTPAQWRLVRAASKLEFQKFALY